MSQHSTFRSRISRRCVPPSFVSPFQPHLIFAKMQNVCQTNLKIEIFISTCASYA